VATLFTLLPLPGVGAIPVDVGFNSLTTLPLASTK
jgi:hypothetical protein